LPFVVRTLSIRQKWQAIPEKNKNMLNIINQHLQKLQLPRPSQREEFFYVTKIVKKRKEKEKQ
jgi:hypothetical protein